MANFQLDTADAAANVSASFRTFNNYLRSGATSDSNTSIASVTGVYDNSSTSVMTGDTSYDTTGIYRSQTVPFLKKIDGTQTYLKTNVTFA